MAYVTVQAKTSLVHTSKFATLEVDNFHMERHKQLKFTEFLDSSWINAQIWLAISLGSKSLRP